MYTTLLVGASQIVKLRMHPVESPAAECCYSPNSNTDGEEDECQVPVTCEVVAEQGHHLNARMMTTRRSRSLADSPTMSKLSTLRKRSRVAPGVAAAEVVEVEAACSPQLCWSLGSHRHLHLLHPKMRWSS